MAAVRIRVLDEYGNVAPYAQLPVRLTLEGEAELVGPDVVTAEGGMTGTYVKTTGKTGEARLTIHTDQTEDVTLIFKITEA
jgi:beta-galactosidase